MFHRARCCAVAVWSQSGFPLPFFSLACFTAHMNDNIWDKLTRVVLVLLLAAAVLGMALWYRPVVEANERMRQDKLELDTKIAKETEVAKKLDAQLRALKDPKTIERLARERLSYAKPGENVIHFDPPVTNAATR
jgi:cell division protein FtsB